MTKRGGNGMGIKEELVKFVASDALLVATDVAKKGVEKASAAADKKAEKRLQKFINTNPDHSHLFLSQVRYQMKETYYIYDQEQKVKYVVKGELMSMKHHLHIYDAEGKTELGEVEEQLVALRSPLTMEATPKDFVIFANGKKVGKVKTRFALTKQKFDVTFNGWSVEGDVFASNYKVMDKDKNIVMTASRKLAYMNDMYYVDITNPGDEFYCVLILLALDSSLMTKGDETKRAVKKKMQL